MLAVQLLVPCRSCCMQNPQNHTQLYVMGAYSVLHTYTQAPQVHWRMHTLMRKTISAAQPQGQANASRTPHSKQAPT